MTMKGMLMVLLFCAGLAAAETPLEAVKAFEKECVAKDQAAALKRIVDAADLGEMEGSYLQQKARRLIELSGEEGRKVEVVTEKTEGGLAAVMIVAIGPGERREIEPLYLRKAGNQWRVIPFSNWRKLPLTDGEKAALQKLEAWTEAEEARLSPPAEGTKDE